MRNLVLKNGAVVSLASTNKEAKVIKQVEERKDSRSVKLAVLSSIIMDYYTHTNNENYLYIQSDGEYGRLSKKVVGDCLMQDVYMYKNIPADIVLLANAILDGKIRKASMIVKKADLRINLSTLLNNTLIIQHENWDVSIIRLNDRYGYYGI